MDAPLMVAIPVPDTEQPNPTGRLLGGAEYDSESCVPLRLPVRVPLSVMLVTAGDVNRLAGPETLEPL